MKRIVARYSPLFILAGLCIIMAIISPGFRTSENIQNVAYRSCVVGLLATGQTLVILTAGIDLSVGSVAALAGVVAALLMKEANVPVIPSVFLGTMVGMLCGTINGLVTTKGRIPPFIITLGMMMAARGAALLLADSKPIFGLPESFRYLGGVKGWWIPVLITLGLGALFAVMLTFTRFGRALYAAGGNLQGARLSGINTDMTRTSAFALCGLMAGFGGVMLASKVGVADPTAAEGMELDAIAACVIGGASLMGGEGGCVGALAGALIMNVLMNFCNLKEFRPEWQLVLIGVLIVVLVFYDNVRKRKAGLIQE